MIEAKYAIGYWFVVSVLFVYAIAVGVWYYLKPSDSRLTSMVKAEKHHRTQASAASAAAAVGSWHHNLVKWRQQWVWISVGVRFVQYLGLIFISDVPWPWSGTSDAGSAVLLDFAFVEAVLQQIFFWFFVAVYIALGALALRRYRAAKLPEPETIPIRKYERWARSLFLSVAFMTATHQLLRFLACTQTAPASTSTVPVVDDLPNMTCWAGVHIVYAVVAIVSSVLLYPWSMQFVMADNSGAFYTVETYQVCTRVFEHCIVLISVFFRTSPAAAMSLLLVLFAVNLSANLWIQPCLGRGRELNHLRSASYAGALWCVVCGVMAVGINDRGNIWSGVMLILAIPCMIGAYVVSRWWIKKLDDSKLAAMALAATSKDVKFQRECYSNMSLLVAVPENRDIIISNVLPGALLLLTTESDNLNNPAYKKLDHTAKVRIIETLANVAADEQHRNAVFNVNIVTPFIKMIDSRKPYGDIEEIRAGLSALANFSNDAKLSYQLFSIHKSFLESVLCLLPHADDIVRRKSIELILNLTWILPATSAEAVEVRDELLAKRNLIRIIRATASRDNVVQLRATRAVTRLIRPKNAATFRELKADGPDFLQKAAASSDPRVVAVAKHAIELLDPNRVKKQKKAAAAAAAAGGVTSPSAGTKREVKDEKFVAIDVKSAPVNAPTIAPPSDAGAKPLIQLAVTDTQSSKTRKLSPAAVVPTPAAAAAAPAPTATPSGPRPSSASIPRSSTLQLTLRPTASTASASSSSSAAAPLAFVPLTAPSLAPSAGTTPKAVPSPRGGLTTPGAARASPPTVEQPTDKPAKVGRTQTWTSGRISEMNVGLAAARRRLEPLDTKRTPSPVNLPGNSSPGTGGGAGSGAAAPASGIGGEPGSAKTLKAAGSRDKSRRSTGTGGPPAVARSSTIVAPRALAKK